MEFTSSSCHLDSSPGGWTMLDPSELQDWQDRKQSFVDPSQEIWGCWTYKPAFFSLLGKAETRGPLPDLMALCQ